MLLAVVEELVVREERRIGEKEIYINLRQATSTVVADQGVTQLFLCNQRRSMTISTWPESSPKYLEADTQHLSFRPWSQNFPLLRVPAPDNELTLPTRHVVTASAPDKYLHVEQCLTGICPWKRSGKCPVNISVNGSPILSARCNAESWKENLILFPEMTTTVHSLL